MQNEFMETRINLAKFVTVQHYSSVKNQERHSSKAKNYQFLECTIFFTRQLQIRHT